MSATSVLGLASSPLLMTLAKSGPRLGVSKCTYPKLQRIAITMNAERTADRRFARIRSANAPKTGKGGQQGQFIHCPHQPQFQYPQLPDEAQRAQVSGIFLGTTKL